MTGWVEKLDAASRATKSLVCVGLDPDPRRMALPDTAAFNRAIVDATHDLACAYKLQLAFYEALGLPGLEAMAATVRHIREAAPGALVIGDAKRGDIGSTAEAYARAMFDVWGFDTVTVHSYLGRDSVEPFLDHPKGGALIVCRTSNPGAPQFQDLRVGGGENGPTLYQEVARAADEWNTRGNVGLVVGATYPRQLRELRQAHPRLPILVPGVGAQGGDVRAAALAGVDERGRGVMIASSRHIIYASRDPADFALAARRATAGLRDEINAALADGQGSA